MMTLTNAVKQPGDLHPTFSVISDSWISQGRSPTLAPEWKVPSGIIYPLDTTWMPVLLQNF
jgi:hypothetical protein